jgi:hypothetical protein
MAGIFAERFDKAVNAKADTSSDNTRPQASRKQERALRN